MKNATQPLPELRATLSECGVAPDSHWSLDLVQGYIGHQGYFMRRYSSAQRSRNVHEAKDLLLKKVEGIDWLKVTMTFNGRLVRTSEELATAMNAVEASAPI